MKMVIDNRTNYRVTNHARLRFNERVVKEGNNGGLRLKEWLKKALFKGYKVDSDGVRDRYRYGYYLLVMDNNVLVTISYYSFNEFPYFQEEINKGNIEVIRKEAQFLVEHRKEILIRVNEIDIKRIKSNSDDEQQVLKEEIEELTLKASIIRKQIKALLNLGNKYKYTKNDIIPEGSLI